VLGRYKTANNVRVTLHTAINTVASSLVVDTASGVFQNPADPAGDAPSNGVAIATITDSLVTPTKTEIVTYTSLTNNGDGTLTLGGVTRAQEGTTAQSFTVGAIVMQTLTVGQLTHPYLTVDQAAGTLAIAANTAVTGGLTQQDGATSGFRAILAGALFTIARYSSGFKNRWRFGLINTETGSGNTGSDFAFQTFTDAGTLSNASAFVIKRSNGNVGIGQSPDATAKLAVSGDILTDASAAITGGHLYTGGLRTLNVCDIPGRGALFLQADGAPATVVNFKVTDNSGGVHQALAFDVTNGNATFGGNINATFVSAGPTAAIPPVANATFGFAGPASLGSVGGYLAQFSNNALGPVLGLAKARGTASSQSIVSNNDTIAAINAIGARTSSAWSVMAQISFEADGVPSTTSMPGRIVFNTTNAGSLTPTEAMRINSDGSLAVVGAATFADAEVAGALTAGGMIQQAAVTSITAPAGTTNNAALSSFTTTGVYRVNTPSAATYTGIAGGAGQRVVTLFNLGPSALTLAHENASSSAQNRFKLPGGTNVVVGSDDSVTLWYDASTLRWRIKR
jgi:hypothetical protein